MVLTQGEQLAQAQASEAGEQDQGAPSRPDGVGQVEDQLRSYDGAFGRSLYASPGTWRGLVWVKPSGTAVARMALSRR